MRVVVTCGPSYEPIDQVRRLTNFSTGELGIMLANRLTRAGFEVICFKGVGATCPLRIEGARTIPFATNDNLRAELEGLENREQVAAVFHAAALCDYRVKSTHASNGAEIAAAKIPSRSGDLTLTLEPVPKLIAELRALFPASRIVGWKYELNGTPAEVIEAAERQMAEAGTDACVVNGAAFGPGFGVCEPGVELAHCADKARLCAHLARWIERLMLNVETPQERA
jgi:phosphopantothenoylcysteine synthetase/decarboxylase